MVQGQIRFHVCFLFIYSFGLNSRILWYLRQFLLRRRSKCSSKFLSLLEERTIRQQRLSGALLHAFLMLAYEIFNPLVFLKALQTAFVGHCTKTRTQSVGQTVGRCQLECCSHKRTVPLAWKECAAFYAHSRFGNLVKVFLWKLGFSRKKTLKIDQSFGRFKSYFLHG